MYNKKNGNPHRASRFICLKCGKENYIGAGIQRKSARGPLHIKDLYCLNCQAAEKSVEVRFCDDYKTVAESVPKLRSQYY